MVIYLRKEKKRKEKKERRKKKQKKKRKENLIEKERNKADRSLSSDINETN